MTAEYKGPKADIAFPVYGAQSPRWWVPMMRNYAYWKEWGYAADIIHASSAMPDTTKNLAANVVEPYTVNVGLTSYNRNRLAVESHADYLLFVDHDTALPKDALPRLLEHQLPIVAGVYFLKGEKKHPLMYMKTDDGLYRPLDNYIRGALMEVDAIGMGCTLIHRDVFKAIRDTFLWVQLPEDGTQTLVNKKDVKPGKLPAKFRVKETTLFGDASNGYYRITPARDLPSEYEEKFDYPYYDMAHGRTEDLPFCEKAKACGFSIMVDTAVECSHVGEYETTVDDYIAWKMAAQERGEL